MTASPAAATFTEREPTADERRNGWSKDSLNRYLAEREAQTSDYAARNVRKRVEMQNTRNFNPHRW